MSKHYQNDPNLVKDIAKNTERIEKEYSAKQAKKRHKKIEKEELSQREIAPLLLVITLVLGFLISIIFKK
jgi:hypothetical protein